MMTGKISTHHASRRIVLPKAMSLRSAEDPAMGVPHVANRLVTNHTFANWNFELSMAKAWELSGRSTDLGNDSRRRKLPDDQKVRSWKLNSFSHKRVSMSRSLASRVYLAFSFMGFLPFGLCCWISRYRHVIRNVNDGWPHRPQIRELVCEVEIAEIIPPVQTPIRGLQIVDTCSTTPKTGGSLKASGLGERWRVRPLYER